MKFETKFLLGMLGCILLTMGAFGYGYSLALNHAGREVAGVLLWFVGVVCIAFLIPDWR